MNTDKLDLDFFENIILLKSLTDETYLASIIDTVKPHYFKNKDIQSVFSVIKDYYSKRGVKPNTTEIKAHLVTEELKESFKKAISLIKDLDKNYNIDELTSNTEKFLREKAVYHTMLEVVDDINKNNVDTSNILNKFEKACNISLATNIGLDLLEDTSVIIDDLTNEEKYISSKWKWLDKKLGGGFLENGRSLYVFAGETNIGKSIFLGNAAINMASQGKTVLLVTLEMPELIYAKRLCTNITKIPLYQLKSETTTLFQQLQEYKNENTNAKIIIKEFPPSSITCNHLKAFIKKIVNKGIKIDALVVDYINLIHSTIGNNTYERVKHVTEQLRALSYVFNFPIVSATQLNRAGYDISDPGLNTLSESMGLGHTADVILSIWQEDTDKELGVIKMGLMKNRFGENFGVCNMKIDYSTLTLTEDEINNDTEASTSSIATLTNLSL
jgi:replicative DNA helicase